MEKSVMIRSFSCENFRNIACDDLEFARINILIGANNAGKSNFIRALSFAANMVSTPQIEPTGFLSELKRNGWNTAVNKKAVDSSFRFVWNFDLLKGHSVAYTLCANTSKKREENYIIEESLDGAEAREGALRPYNFFRCHSFKVGSGEFSTAGMTGAKNKRLRTDVNKYESVLLQMDNLFFENKKLFSTPFVRDEIRNVLESMRAYFRSFYSYSCTAFDIATIREMQDEQADGSYLKKNGVNFVNVFANQMDSDLEFKNRYLSVLKKLVSDCEDVRICDAGGKIWMELKIKGYFFPLSEVSDGTVHLLILLLLLNFPEYNGISMLAIDEPEMNLHPAWQKLLANEILRCQSFEQCFISTHSPDFLDEFTEEFLSGSVGIFVFDPCSRIPLRKLDKEEMRSELNDWTLGDLYRIGDPMIGGWPQ